MSLFPLGASGQLSLDTWDLLFGVEERDGWFFILLSSHLARYLARNFIKVGSANLSNLHRVQFRVVLFLGSLKIHLANS